MSIIGLDHLLLAIPEGGEDTARVFYCGLLGFSEIAKPDSLAGRGGLWLLSGAVTLHLGVEQNYLPPQRAHPGLLVDNLAALLKILRKAGVALTFDVPLPGYERVHIRDPFGNRLELMQKLA
jgi:catechol 2,3-dioxygenase-like lactoylglutathione lyase family enzyme